MANKSFYDPKDVPSFQDEICKKECVMKGKCIEDKRDNHWFLMCPHYFNWKMQIPKSFVTEQLEWEMAHPEEAEKKHQEKVARAKAWKESQRKKK